MKRIVVSLWVAALSVFLGSQIQAQTFGAPEVMKGKVVVGGDFGAGFYGNSFHLGVAPQAGFRLTRSLELGVRLGYDLNYFHDYYYGGYYCHYFSGALYANYEIFRGIYVHAEDEEMCELIRGSAVNPIAPSWYNSIFVGAGYRQYFSPTGFVYYAILYNLSWDYSYNGYINSPYASPFVIRVGYCYAF